jgi:5-methylcytosine-specific restriction protein A
VPDLPPKKCATPGCAKPAERDTGHCAEHSTERGEARADRQRDAQRKYHGANWKRLRKAVIADEPLCRDCLRRGLLNPTTDVDHIDGDWSNDSRENLQGLCHQCHSRKTVLEQGGFGR